MGEIYKLTLEQLQEYLVRVISLRLEFEKIKSFAVLQLYIVLLYEFAEMYAVNGSELQAKLGRAKDFYEDSDLIRKLFNYRGKIVHRNYLVVENDLLIFYKTNLEVIIALEQFFQDNLELKEDSSEESIDAIKCINAF